MADRIDQQAYDQRIETCKSCHLWEPHTTRCKGCGCLMLTKARWRLAVCPLKRWPDLRAES